ncbi:hypothetical protein [Blastochloris viridis]|uniref:Uncharacterized protein n=1 Tax=Blastochloris viridis TaxID=1079 RepID=A0A0H5BCU1_BLAVI|nr:hypothetical protein [Blastochloris viridis]ALK10067.1 hypothetical protein BVIR_2299 [Blastochloris viridis]BAS00011.1 hypothetical protein BV133_2417 [Blastochloris viridis]CUU42731.1 hypothetical protein BVIRIDIS_17450 [Blastochloris viridis]
MTASTGAFVIEIDDETVGIVVPDENRAFRFFASLQAYGALEQRSFANPRAAQQAAMALTRERRVGRRPEAAYN